MRTGKIYIIPSRFGAIFFVSVITMLLIGATYANNLVNMLAFFLLAISLVAMVQTHNNLKNVRLHLVKVEPAFANTTLTIVTALENNGQGVRFNLNAQPARLKLEREHENTMPLSARSVLRLKADYKCGSRGQHRIERMRVSTVYPLGLFYAWMWLATDETYFIYPEPKGERPLPAARLDPKVSSHAIARGGDDFHGHRRYQAGDSARRVDWKAHARGRPLLIKEFDEGDPQALLFSWFELGDLSTEERLSQLTAWVERARTQRLAFALKLPNIYITAGDDLQHHTRCLEELAVFQEGEGHAKAS